LISSGDYVLWVLLLSFLSIFYIERKKERKEEVNNKRERKKERKIPIEIGVGGRWPQEHIQS